MISRREFFVGIGSGLILPRFFERALARYEKQGEPLLLAPETPEATMTAVRWCAGDDFQLLLGDPEERPPGSMTLEDYVNRYGGSDMETAEEDWDMALHDPMPEEAVFAAWCRKESPNARAYELLDSLHLGPLVGAGDSVGEITFIDGACPGNDYLGVEAATELDLSLLQHRLTELRSGIRLEVAR